MDKNIILGIIGFLVVLVISLSIKGPNLTSMLDSVEEITNAKHAAIRKKLEEDNAQYNAKIKELEKDLADRDKEYSVLINKNTKLKGKLDKININITKLNDKRVKGITVKNLLNHTSGWTNKKGDPMFMNLSIAMICYVNTHHRIGTIHHILMTESHIIGLFMIFNTMDKNNHRDRFWNIFWHG